MSDDILRHTMYLLTRYGRIDDDLHKRKTLMDLLLKKMLDHIIRDCEIYCIMPEVGLTEYETGISYLELTSISYYPEGLGNDKELIVTRENPSLVRDGLSHVNS